MSGENCIKVKINNNMNNKDFSESTVLYDQKPLETTPTDDQNHNETTHIYNQKYLASTVIYDHNSH